MVFAQCCKQRTIPFFTLYGCWELKLRYYLVKVGSQYIDDLNPCSVHCGNNNKDEDNSLKTLNDKNHQASSQKFRQLITFDMLY